MPYAKRTCEVCLKEFRPTAGDHVKCLEHRNLATEERSPSGYEGYRPGGPLPKAPSHQLAPPLRQAVVDLETFSLDRGWGVTMVGCVLVHGASSEPVMHTFDLTETQAWKKGKRSNDSELVANIIKVLADCHIAYAHNGRNFDIPWLNTVALKYKMPALNIKLIDPVQLARRKYRLGSNSLGPLAAFLGLEEEKMPVPAEVWRKALFDAEPGAWATLRARCQSDVRLLNQVAGRVTNDIGMIDYDGSGWRR